jgi:hypothetical protein
VDRLAAAKAEAQATRETAEAEAHAARLQLQNVSSQRDVAKKEAAALVAQRVILPPQGPGWAWRGASEQQGESAAPSPAHTTAVTGTRAASGGGDGGGGDGSLAPLRVWVGTWNMGAVNPFENEGRGKAPLLMHESLVPPGYDMYARPDST